MYFVFPSCKQDTWLIWITQWLTVSGEVELMVRPENLTVFFRHSFSGSFCDEAKKSLFRSFQHCEGLELAWLFFKLWFIFVPPVQKFADQRNKASFFYRKFFGARDLQSGFFYYFWSFCVAWQIFNCLESAMSSLLRKGSPKLLCSLDAFLGWGLTVV